MARGKVAEWIRKRTILRKPAAKQQSKNSGASELILRKEAALESCGTGAGMVLAVAVLYRHSKSRARAFLSALMRWRPRVNVLIVQCEQVVYHVMWLVESVVLVGRLCFFLMRFGFQQL
ncbi:hypothetical protein VPH35_114792 [Triticum aestivum]